MNTPETQSIPSVDPWKSMRGLTQARIGLQRSGNALSSTDVLQFQADHAAARDAVHTPMDSDGVVDGLRGLGLGEPAVVTSQASSRAEYLRRPDLGRLPEDLSQLPHADAEIGIVLADATHQAGPESLHHAALANIETFFGWVSDVPAFERALGAPSPAAVDAAGVDLAG